jgi:phosphopantothenoylcysteine synthetase/decarboxylase
MGYALAESCASRGAEVILVSGPVDLETNHPNVSIVRVVSADQMYKNCIRFFKECDAAIMSAAVADFTPVTSSQHKIKRTKSRLSIELKPTKDIAASLGQIKKINQVLAGFALESDDENSNALKKIKMKNLDFIVLNSLRDPGAGFGKETNKITIIDKHNNIQEFELKTKREVAEDIVDELEKWFNDTEEG